MVMFNCFLYDFRCGRKCRNKKLRPDQKPIILINCQSRCISCLRPRLMATSMQPNTQATTSDMWPEKCGYNQWSLITSNRKFMILYLQPYMNKIGTRNNSAPNRKSVVHSRKTTATDAIAFTSPMENMCECGCVLLPIALHLSNEVVNCWFAIDHRRRQKNLIYVLEKVNRLTPAQLIYATGEGIQAFIGCWTPVSLSHVESLRRKKTDLSLIKHSSKALDQIINWTILHHLN